MIREILDFWQPLFLYVSRDCQLRCLGCPVWQSRPTYTDDGVPDFSTLIREGRFFDWYPRRRTIHIWGGDPLMFADLAYLVAFLKSENIRVVLWVNGQAPLDDFVSLSDFVDRWFLFCPGVDAGVYREWTGVDGWAHFQSVVSVLKERRADITLHFPVSSENVGWLPYVYEYGFQVQLPVWIHVRKGAVTADSMAHVTRFFSVKGVWVFVRYVFDTDALVCRAVPRDVFERGWFWQILKNVFHDRVAVLYRK